MMNTLAVIMARAGSKGLPDKCVLPLLGSPVISYTINHARDSRLVDQIVLTTDSVRASAIGRAAGIEVIDRPADLASDTASVCAVVQHAVRLTEDRAEGQFGAIVILYGNVPVRSEGIIDRCVDHLVQTGCDSVRTVAPVTKQHPDWIHRLESDRMIQFRPNSIHRRQDLEPLYYHDGAVVVVKRDCLFGSETADDPHAFFGQDCRAIIQNQEDSVDIDALADFYLAEAVLRAKYESMNVDRPTAGSRQPPFTAAAIVR